MYIHCESSWEIVVNLREKKMKIEGVGFKTGNGKLTPSLRVPVVTLFYRLTVVNPHG